MPPETIPTTPADKALHETIELMNKLISEMIANQQHDSTFRFQYLLWKVLDERMKAV